MLKRPSWLRCAAKTFREEITLAPGETPESRFKTWLADKLARPRFCATHQQIRLVVADGDESGIFKVYVNYHSIYEPARERPGVFQFCVALRCPACICAYALVPPEFHETSFETFNTSTPERANALARCRQFAAHVNKQGCGFAQLVGPPGTGKTRLASNIVRELDDRDALYVRQGELTIALRATYGRKDVFLHRHQRSDYDDEAGDNEPTTPLEIAQGVRFLVLDEIGCSPLANDERLLLDELLKYRYDERKPTVLISNLPLDQLRDFLGDALADRISHAAGNGKFILQFSGESFRRSTGEEYLEGIK